MGLIGATVGAPFVLAKRGTHDPSYCYLDGSTRSRRAMGVIQPIHPTLTLAECRGRR